MLLELLIILSSNSFYFNQPKIIPSVKHSTTYITNLYSYGKITIIYLTYIYMKSKKDLWFSQLAKGIFSELRCYGYE